MKKIFVSLFSLFFALSCLAEQDEDQTKLGSHMDELSSLLKSLRKFEDTDWVGKAGAVQKAQEELLKCFPLIPQMLEGMEEGTEKAKHVATYKKLLGLNYAKLCELELALYEEDEDLVDDTLSELKSIKKDGHTQFIED